jgi:hypothetical protein
MENTSQNNEELINIYIQSLPEKKYKAYSIAKSHLGSTFNAFKSIGFLSWKKKKELELEEELKQKKELGLEEELKQKKELEFKNALEKIQEKIKTKKVKNI